MSPRRTPTSGEDSILAMLEREPARKRSAGASNGRRVWYGASATLVLALTATLVWMAASNDGLRPGGEETVVAEAEGAPRPSTAAPGDSPTGAATVLQVAMAPASTAVIVDQAPPSDGLPPLRLLKPAAEKAGPEKSAAPLRAPSSAPVRAALAPPRPVAKTTPLPRPAAVTPAKPRPAVVAKSAVKPAQPRSQRGVNPAPPVDADVALISAVIVHANGHAPEGSQMTELLCPNESCRPRPARQ